SVTRPPGGREQDLGKESHRRPSSILPSRDCPPLDHRRARRRHRLMRLGFVLAGAATLPTTEFVEVVRETEARGYHTAWTGETAGYDAIAVMAAMAAHSTTLHVGSAVVPVQTRTPTLLGRSAAALGHLAPGRVALGIGLSSRIIVEQWHGLQFSAALAQIREAVQIIRLVTAGERVNFEGAFYRVKNFRLVAPPAPVRIVLAALGPAMLELAGPWPRRQSPTRSARKREARTRLRLSTAGGRVDRGRAFYRVKTSRLVAPPAPVRSVLAALGPEMLELAGEIASSSISGPSAASTM